MEIAKGVDTPIYMQVIYSIVFPSSGGSLEARERTPMRNLKTVLAAGSAAFLLMIALAPVLAPAFAAHECDDSYPPVPNCEVLGHMQEKGPGSEGEGDPDVAGTRTGGEELPFTGADLTLYVLGGVVLIGGGALIARRARRSHVAA